MMMARTRASSRRTAAAAAGVANTKKPKMTKSGYEIADHQSTSCRVGPYPVSVELVGVPVDDDEDRLIIIAERRPCGLLDEEVASNKADGGGANNDLDEGEKSTHFQEQQPLPNTKFDVEAGKLDGQATEEDASVMSERTRTAKERSLSPDMVEMKTKNQRGGVRSIRSYSHPSSASHSRRSDELVRGSPDAARNPDPRQMQSERDPGCVTISEPLKELDRHTSNQTVGFASENPARTKSDRRDKFQVEDRGKHKTDEARKRRNTTRLASEGKFRRKSMTNACRTGSAKNKERVAASAANASKDISSLHEHCGVHRVTDEPTLESTVSERRWEELHSKSRKQSQDMVEYENQDELKPTSHSKHDLRDQFERKLVRLNENRLCSDGESDDESSNASDGVRNHLLAPDPTFSAMSLMRGSQSGLFQTATEPREGGYPANYLSPGGELRSSYSAFVHPVPPAGRAIYVEYQHQSQRQGQQPFQLGMDPYSEAKPSNWDRTFKTTFSRMRDHLRSLSRRRPTGAAESWKGTRTSESFKAFMDGIGSNRLPFRVPSGQLAGTTRSCHLRKANGEDPAELIPHDRTRLTAKLGNPGRGRERVNSGGSGGFSVASWDACSQRSRDLKSSPSNKSVSSWKSRKERSSRSYLYKVKEQLAVLSSSATDVAECGGKGTRQVVRPSRPRRRHSSSPYKKHTTAFDPQFKGFKNHPRSPIHGSQSLLSYHHLESDPYSASDAELFNPDSKRSQGAKRFALDTCGASWLEANKNCNLWLTQADSSDGMDRANMAAQKGTTERRTPWASARVKEYQRAITKGRGDGEDVSLGDQAKTDHRNKANENPQRKESFNRLLDTYLKKNQEATSVLLKSKVAEKAGTPPSTPSLPRGSQKPSVAASSTRSKSEVRTVKDCKRFWQQKDVEQRQQLTWTNCIKRSKSSPPSKCQLSEPKKAHPSDAKIPLKSNGNAKPQNKPSRISMSPSRKKVATVAVDAMLKRRLDGSKVSSIQCDSPTLSKASSAKTRHSSSSNPARDLVVRDRSGAAALARASTATSQSLTVSGEADSSFRKEWRTVVESISCGKKKGSKILPEGGDTVCTKVRQEILDKLEENSNSDDEMEYILHANNCRDDLSSGSKYWGLVEDSSPSTSADSFSSSGTQAQQPSHGKKLGAKEAKSCLTVSNTPSSADTLAKSANMRSDSGLARGSSQGATISATTVASTDGKSNKQKMRIIHVKKPGKVKDERLKFNDELKKRRVLPKAKSDSTLTLKSKTIKELQEARANEFREKLAKMTKSEMQSELLTAEGELLALEHKFKNSLKECEEIRKDLSDRGVEHIAITFAHLPVVVDLLDLGDYLLQSLLSPGSGDSDNGKWLNQESVTKVMIKVLDTICFILQQAALRPVLLLLHWLEKVFEALKDSAVVATLSRWKARILEGAYAFVSKGSSGLKEFQTASIEVAQNLGRKSSEISRKLYNAGLLPPVPEESSKDAAADDQDPASPGVARINSFKQDMMKMLHPIIHEFSEDERIPTHDQLYPEALDIRRLGTSCPNVPRGRTPVPPAARKEIHFLSEHKFTQTSVIHPGSQLQAPQPSVDASSDERKLNNGRATSKSGSKNGKKRQGTVKGVAQSAGDGKKSVASRISSMMTSIRSSLTTNGTTPTISSVSIGQTSKNSRLAAPSGNSVHTSSVTVKSSGDPMAAAVKPAGKCGLDDHRPPGGNKLRAASAGTSSVDTVAVRK